MPNAWTTPTYGVPRRPLNAALKIELDFASDPDPVSLRLWEVMRLLLPLLGDHKVRIQTLAPERVLVDNTRPWRSMRYGCDLQTTLAGLGEDKLWSDCERVFQSHTWIEVERGTRERRHPVWWWHCEPAVHSGPPVFEVAICAAHVPKGHATELQRIVDRVFDIGAGLKCCRGGRAGFVSLVPGPIWPWDDSYEAPRPDGYLPATGSGLIQGRFAWGRRVPEKAMVPFLTLSNLLPSEIVKKIGAERLKAMAHELTHDAEYPAYDCRSLQGGFVGVQFGDLDENALNAAFTRDGLLDIDNVGYRWLAKELANHKLFLFQDESWEKETLRQARLDRQQSLAHAAAERQVAKRSRFQEKSKQELTNEMKHVWANPPRCIRDVSVVASPDDAERSKFGLHESVTQFWVRRSGHEDAYTIYGRPSGEASRLNSPIRAGSPRAERAIFVFDSEIDGWDGETDTRERLLDRPRVGIRQISCPECKGRKFRLKAGFEYDLDDLADDPAAWAHRQDYFSWFWLIGYCATCKWSGLIADIECA